MASPESDNSLEKKVEALEKENKKLRKKIDRLQKTMEITTRHSDVVTSELEEKVETSIKEIEERVRLISETIPVPVIIANVSDGKILYVNEHSCNVFGFSSEEFLKIRASDLYKNSEDRIIFLKAVSKQGRVSDFEVRLKKSNGEPFWVALFSQSLKFRNESCVLTVIYDLTERRKAENEIRRLKEELNQKEEKYLLFKLEDVEYGIEIMKVREIVRMMPMTPIINAPPYVKGVINLRGRLIPVTDLRLRLGMESVAYNHQTCIIIIETGDKKSHRLDGIIVDAVTDVCGIIRRDIEPPQSLNLLMHTEFISGIAKTDNGNIKIFLNCSHLVSDEFIFDG